MAIGSKDLATEQLDGLDNARLVEELKKAKEEKKSKKAAKAETAEVEAGEDAK